MAFNAQMHSTPTNHSGFMTVLSISHAPSCLCSHWLFCLEHISPLNSPFN